MENRYTPKSIEKFTEISLDGSNGIFTEYIGGQGKIPYDGGAFNGIIVDFAFYMMDFKNENVQHPDGTIQKKGTKVLETVIYRDPTKDALINKVDGIEYKDQQSLRRKYLNAKENTKLYIYDLQRKSIIVLDAKGSIGVIDYLAKTNGEIDRTKIMTFAPKRFEQYFSIDLTEKPKDKSETALIKEALQKEDVMTMFRSVDDYLSETILKKEEMLPDFY